MRGGRLRLIATITDYPWLRTFPLTKLDGGFIRPVYRVHPRFSGGVGGSGRRLIPGDYVPYPVCTDDAREAGEIVVGGYNVMAGDRDDPATTAEASDAVGWVHTGDVGWLDDAGNLRITDRIKDHYIAGGFNVDPAEVENVLTARPRSRVSP